MVTVSELADQILAAFRKAAETKGVGEITATELYNSFRKEGSHDMIHHAIKSLLVRDYIAAHGYSLTAKGRMRPVTTSELK